MSEHLTQKQLVDYRERKLPAAELLSLSDHLSACEECRRQVERALNGEAAFFALQSEIFAEVPAEISSAAPPHLTSEQMSEYIDGALSGEERQAVTDHVASCEWCALATADLRDFRNQIAPSLNREYHPAPRPAGSESRRQRLAAFLPSPWSRSPVLLFGTALSALLLTVAGWMLWQTFKNKGEKPEIATTTPSPALSATATPTVPPALPPEDTTSSVIAELDDGTGRVILDKEGKLSGMDHVPPAYRQMVRVALANGRLERSPLLAGLSRPASSLMGGDEQGNQFSVTEPVGKVMLSDRPTFRWSPLAGATGYVVEVYDERFNLVAASPRLAPNSWTAPQPLRRGQIYSWQVKAIKDGQESLSPRPPAPQAKFRILDRAKASELARAQQAHASSHLTLGLLYAEAGLLDEAERELSALQRANPNSALVGRLLSSVRAMRR